MAVPNWEKVVSLKGEFEAEGLSREAAAIEALHAARHGLDYLIKIGGCEAKADVAFLRQFQITSLVAPMIESGFAMEKYMSMVSKDHFHHIGVTIETYNAVDRIEEILDAGTKLTNVTIGRTDLTASFRGSSVDSQETIEKVKIVSRAAKRRGLEVTMGGTLNVNTVELLRSDHELAELLDTVETRKVIMTVDHFLEPGALNDAFVIEMELLQLRTALMSEELTAAQARIAQIKERL